MSLGHNTVAGQKLLQFIERIERLKAEQKSIGDDIKVVRAEAEASGFSTKGINLALKARAMKPSKFREEEDVRDLYLHAIGIGAPPPLFRHVEALGNDALGKSQFVELMKDVVPLGASVIIDIDGAPMRLFRDAEGNARSEEVKRPTHDSRDDAPSASLPARQSVEVPDCSPEQAEVMGGAAYLDDKPITANPFPFGDKRQPRWDAGWRKRSGSDGMGPDTGDDKK